MCAELIGFIDARFLSFTQSVQFLLPQPLDALKRSGEGGLRRCESDEDQRPHGVSACEQAQGVDLAQRSSAGSS